MTGNLAKWSIDYRGESQLENATQVLIEDHPTSGLRGASGKSKYDSKGYGNLNETEAECSKRTPSGLKLLRVHEHPMQNKDQQVSHDNSGEKGSDCPDSYRGKDGWRGSVNNAKPGCSDTYDKKLPQLRCCW